MSTKQSPGAFNCYKAALPDEPIFVILGRDPAGPATLDKWAHERILLGKNVTPDDRERLREAINQATEMVEWRARMMEASVDGTPPWRLPMSFVTDETSPVCVLQPAEVQDARIVAAGLRHDAKALRTLVNENDDWIGALQQPLLDLVDSIASRAAMLESAGLPFSGDDEMAGDVDFTGDKYPFAPPEPIQRAFIFGEHPPLTIPEIVSKLDRLRDLESPKQLYWTNAEQSKKDEDGTPIKMLSAVRVSEFLDYATCYGEFDENTPNGTKSVYGDTLTSPMNDLRRHAIFILKRVLGLIPENASIPATPELDEVCRRQEQTVGKSPRVAPMRPPINNRAALLARVNDVTHRLSDGRKPTPFDLYRAIRNEGVGTGWRYEALNVGLNFFETLRDVLKAEPQFPPCPPFGWDDEQMRTWLLRVLTRAYPEGYPVAAENRINKWVESNTKGRVPHPLEAPYSGDATVKGNPYEAFARNMTAGGVEVPVSPPTMDTASDDLAHSPEVPSHRFAQFHKAGRYAYAKGLEVNPVHLPTALDEMAKSGWHLVCMFGATESKHVGFVFERRVEFISLDMTTHGVTSPREIIEAIREAEADTAERDRGRGLLP